MTKIFTILIIVVCMTLIGCQGPGVTQDQLDKLKSEIEETQNYITTLRVHCDSMRTIQSELFKMYWEIDPIKMERIFGIIGRDTFPGPRPPDPPWKPIETPIEK